MRRPESKFASPNALLHAKQLGQAVRAARLARNSTQEAMAERARMSALTWLKIEKGEVSVAMGAWLSALEHTGLLDRLTQVHDQKSDVVGEQLRKDQLRKRARGSDEAVKKFDF
ncbi:helix-turn-helix transcriptional regulator [Rhodoferax sp.]|uniref:helix-turn-helix domain-containing protein n=1 Tax=Rhodoferax sp. TaxID=50421 RepID=UPI002719D651|nr:helix-turn-helix transcriptional regulator [Rhodoferax sp.]MDO8319245.1 helix-turn-helix transcriptional regulator [Rhodoferax sp.]MDP2680610.1 helix-turn-helix transcriptional regulator [Rhodoferax sp.]